jgi:hypothetical protein
MADWKLQSKQKYDLGKHIQEPSHHLTFPNALPSANQFRTEKLKAELSVVKIWDDLAKKDRLGRKRRNSLDHVKGAAWSKAKKSLEEVAFVRQEFVADKPKKYKPKYKTRKKKVRFVEPTPPRELEEEPDPATEVNLKPAAFKNLSDMVQQIKD